MFKAPRYFLAFSPVVLLLACGNGELERFMGGRSTAPSAPPAVVVGPSPAPVAPAGGAAVGPPPVAVAPPSVVPPVPPAVPTPPPASPRPRTALLVVGNPDNVGNADETLEDELDRLDFRVSLADDDDSARDAEDFGVVVISASAAQGTLGSEYRDIDVPVVVLEAFVFGDMRMTGPAENEDFGANNGTQIRISDPDSPLSAGLTGNVTICEANAAIHWGVPGPGAQVIAALSNNARRIALFAYEKGAAMTGLTAPARRVGFFASQTVSDRLSDDGLELFSAAVEWAWGGAAAPVAR